MRLQTPKGCEGMGSWKDRRPRQLKKVVYAINDHNLKKVVKDHEERGWARASEDKEYGYGLGCLMIWNRQ
jgi:predicted unusual protein kinase regulating ubiquinone biosynthesis (AarF/ABC1/UbiB family)